MLLKANKYRKDKKADCRQNELGSRIFVGRVFVDYAKCLHFYPSANCKCKLDTRTVKIS